MAQIDVGTLMLVAETLVRLKAERDTFRSNATMETWDLTSASPYVAQVRLSQPAIDQIKSQISADDSEESDLNETLRLVLASVTTPSP